MSPHFILLRRAFMKHLLLLLVCLLPVLPAAAETGVSCHCFQDREFDPDRPVAADPYFLAAGQSSLFAAVSGEQKRVLVRARMTGTAWEELWIGWYLAQAAGVGRERVAELHGAGQTWAQVAAALRIPAARLEKNFARELQNGRPANVLATLVVDEVLAGHFGANPAEVRKLRAAGADDQQAVLAQLLARKSGRPAPEQLAAVKHGGQSWSALLSEAGISSANIESEVRRLVK